MLIKQCRLEDKICIVSNLKRFLQSFRMLLVLYFNFNFNFNLFLDLFYNILTKQDVVINCVTCYLDPDVLIFQFQINITFYKYALVNTWCFSCPWLFRLLEDRHENTNWYLNKYEQFINCLFSIYTPMPFEIIAMLTIWNYWLYWIYSKFIQFG